LKSDNDKYYGYLVRGYSNYKCGDISGALNNFKKIDENADDRFKAFKHNCIGLCYFSLGKLYDKEAEEEYCTAIKFNSNLPDTYYNLAVLHSRRKKVNEAIERLDECLAVDRNFAPAKEAKDKLGNSGGSDWFDWWFRRGRGKMALGIALIISLLVPIATFAVVIHELYIMTNNLKGLTSLISSNISIMISGLLAAIGIIIGILLLPSLQKFKVASAFELEIVPINTNNIIDMKPSSPMPIIQADMPLRNPLESFHMVLQSLNMPIKYPVRDIRVPMKSEPMR
jgi:tetratricopeptide (TPR) repeat protein